MLAMTGILRLAASKWSSVIAKPARRAIATMWMTALVEQPIAIATVIALRKARSVWILSGVRPSRTISTMRRPAAAHMRMWLESAARIDDAPGSVMPITSASAVMVEAVPIVMQTP